MEEIILKNGLRLAFYHTPSYSISLGLYVKAGSMYENINNNGITHFLEHLHFRQLGDWNQDDIYYNMEKIGSTLRAITYQDMLRFYMKIHPDFIISGVEFFNRILTTYHWEQTEIDMERSIILNELAEKSQYVNIDPLMQRLIWKGHSLSYPIIGTENNINHFSFQELIGTKQKFFKRDSLLFIVTGNYTEAHIEYVCKTFENIVLDGQVHNQSHIISARNMQFNRNPDVLLEECPWDIADIKLSFDIDLNSISAYELELLNSIIGGGTGAKLVVQLREKEGLSYNVNSYTEIHEETAVLHIFLSAQKHNIVKCLKEIMFILNSVKKLITEKDMEVNAPFYTDNTWFWLEDPELLNFVEGWHGFIRTGSLFTVEDVISSYRRITRERLMEVANLIFQPANASVVVLGSLEHIKTGEIEGIFNAL